MIKMLLTVLAIGAGLGLCTASIHLGDRSVLTSPPDAVAEGFVRELASERYERALPYLADSAQSRISVDTLRQYRAVKLRDETAWDVSSQILSETKANATARAVVRYAEGDSVVFRFPLEFSSGSWSITYLPRMTDHPRSRF
jgi:hypothetical protein